MLSDVSSLTEMSSEDDTFVPASKAKKPKAKKPWQPKQVLKAPRLTQYSALTLYEEILNGKVDLDPEYQRDVVWSDAKQSGLIDSLLRNFFIPPIIFAFSQSEDGEEKRTCIDGKQRLTSIQRFMDGQIPFKDSRTNLKMWYKLQPGNKSGKLLPVQYRTQFARKQISCVEYSDITDDAEREIFQRVQLGVALTPAERMQAIPGPWTQLIRDVLNVMEEYKISDSLEWSKTRGRDFQSAASIVYLMEKPNSNYPAATGLERWLQRVTPPTKAFKEHVMDTFAVFRQLVLTKKFSHVFQKPTRVSPIEFVMIVVLVDTHFRDHTLTQLADGISRMRKDVRSKHDDIRANTKVTKTMSSFIKDRWPKDLKKSDPAEKKALAACRANPVAPPLEKGKRKRGDYSGSDDSDEPEDERPLKSKAKMVAKTASSTSASAVKSSTSQVAPSASRASTTISAPTKVNSSTKVKSEATPASESRPTGKPDRLAELRKARAKAALGAQSQSQGPTPPPTTGSTSSARQTPAPQTPTNTQDPAMKETVSRIINQSNQPSVPQQQLWPGQFNPQMTVSTMPPSQGTGPSPTPFPSQFSQQMFQPNMPPQGQGLTSHSMMPSLNPNGTSASSGAGTTDPRMNSQRTATYPTSGPPTPVLNGVNSIAGPSAADMQKPSDSTQGAPPNHPYQRSMSISTAPGTGNGFQGRESRFDRGPQSNAAGYRDGGSSSFRNDSPRQPPTEPRGRGQGSPGMKGRPWYPGSTDRERDVLGGYSGGLNGRDRDRDWSNYNGGGWSNRNGR